MRSVASSGHSRSTRVLSTPGATWETPALRPVNSNEPSTNFVTSSVNLPNRAEPHNNLGTVLKELERYDEAAVCFERALDLNEAYAEAHNNLGTTLQYRDRFEQAVVHYERAIAIDPQLTPARINLANVHNDLGRPERAVAGYLQALDCDPTSAEARFNLALAQLKQGPLRTGVG